MEFEIDILTLIMGGGGGCLNNCRNFQNEKVSLSRSGGMKHLHNKNRPTLGGIPDAESEITPRFDRTKNVPASYKRNAINVLETYTCRDPE